jgi:hypothetical protein
VSAIRLAVAASIARLGCPGAPGWMIGAASAVVDNNAANAKTLVFIGKGSPCT